MCPKMAVSVQFALCGATELSFEHRRLGWGAPRDKPKALSVAPREKVRGEEELLFFTIADVHDGSSPSNRTATRCGHTAPLATIRLRHPRTGGAPSGTKSGLA
jgi:hypothetical protein